MRLVTNRAPQGKEELRVVSADGSAVNKMLDFLIGLGAENFGFARHTCLSCLYYLTMVCSSRLPKAHA